MRESCKWLLLKSRTLSRRFSLPLSRHEEKERERGGEEEESGGIIVLGLVAYLKWFGFTVTGEHEEGEGEEDEEEEEAPAESEVKR